MLIIRVHFFFLMIRRPPKSTRTDTLFPYTTLFRSQGEAQSLPLYLGARLRLAPLGLGRAAFFVQLCEGWQGRVVFHKPPSCPPPDARSLPEDRLRPELHSRAQYEDPPGLSRRRTPRIARVRGIFQGRERGLCRAADGPHPPARTGT